jgi:hypothetical protein
MLISKLTQPIIFDGIPDGEVWKSLSPLKLMMYQPVLGNDPREKTEVRIGYDDKYL